MKYFIDEEFLEDGRTIELISIGIVAEDGREYYAEVDLEADVLERVLNHDWLMANVWPHLSGDMKSREQIRDEVTTFITGNHPEFWGYCSAYDWVALNQLFGSMVDHPTKWPFYCNDIAQLAHSKGINHRAFPKQFSALHNALEDARWTKMVYEWLLIQKVDHENS